MCFISSWATAAPGSKVLSDQRLTVLTWASPRRILGLVWVPHRGWQGTECLLLASLLLFGFCWFTEFPALPHAVPRFP